MSPSNVGKSYIGRSKFNARRGKRQRADKKMERNSVNVERGVPAALQSHAFRRSVASISVLRTPFRVSDNKRLVCRERRKRTSTLWINQQANQKSSACKSYRVERLHNRRISMVFFFFSKPSSSRSNRHRVPRYCNATRRTLCRLGDQQFLITSRRTYLATTRNLGNVLSRFEDERDIEKIAGSTEFFRWMNGYYYSSVHVRVLVVASLVILSDGSVGLNWSADDLLNERF